MNAITSLSIVALSLLVAGLSLAIAAVVWRKSASQAAPAPGTDETAAMEEPIERCVLRTAAAAAARAAQSAASRALTDEDRATLGALKLAPSMANMAELLIEAAQSPAPASALFDRLAMKALDEGLANVAAIRGYFADEPRWGEMLEALALLEFSLRFDLATIGVSMDLPLALTVVPFERGGGAGSDVRRLSRITQIRERVLARARNLSSAQTIIVDCPAPGWKSAVSGSRPPSIAVFNPASWVPPP